MSIVVFPWQSDLENMPDPEDMDAEMLKAYCEKVRDAISQLDAAEPRNENSEAYEVWAQDHEELEDILDELLDRMEELE